MIPASGRLRQKNHCNFETNLGSIMSSKPVELHSEIPSQEKKKMIIIIIIEPDVVPNNCNPSTLRN